METVQTIAPVTHDVGALIVHRTLPSPARAMVGPFIFIDQFGPAQFAIDSGMDVRPHPHIGLSTVTYLFDGAIEHRDSLGTFATIEPGAVNLMTAGRGIVHSERSPLSERRQLTGGFGGRMAGMQTWLALPDGMEELPPAFEHVAADAVPMVNAPGVVARVIIGRLWGQTSPVTQHWPTLFADLVLDDAASAVVDAEMEERAVILVTGSANLNGQPMAMHVLHILPPGQAMTVQGQAEGARVMLLGGARFPTPRHVWWNFVSSRPERIAQAKSDWVQGHFDPVPGDSTDSAPLPDWR